MYAQTKTAIDDAKRAQLKAKIAEMEAQEEQAAKKEAERKALEAEAAKEAVKEAAKRQAQAEYESSDAITIKRNIKRAFEQWSKKGEFEKQSDYEERVSTNLQEVFEQICVKEIHARIHSIYEAQWTRILKKESSYDAETETFTVSSAFNGITCQATINIPVANAEQFKNYWFDDLTSKIDEYDWCFVGKSLHPTKLTLVGNDYRDKSKYEVNFPLKNQSVITCSFDELGINNPYLKGYVFNYSEERVREKERHAANEKKEREEAATKAEERAKAEAQEKERQAAEDAKKREEAAALEFNKIHFANRVDEAPAFPGGHDKIFPWIESQLVFPAEAAQKGLHGQVNLRFVVERDGSIGDVVVLTSPDAGFEKEAIRIIKKMPRWSPGKKGGQPVRTWVDEVVRFRPKRASSY
ncbi:hypothetical protein AGMMS49965_00690 [Bacteroidia bacterium]|nr:hypothetical protein AGMMS49965_00690 [Bacteroidia bacterium]